MYWIAKVATDWRSKLDAVDNSVQIKGNPSRAASENRLPYVFVLGTSPGSGRLHYVDAITGRMLVWGRCGLFLGAWICCMGSRGRPSWGRIRTRVRTVCGRLGRFAAGQTGQDGWPIAGLAFTDARGRWSLPLCVNGRYPRVHAG